MKIIFKLFHEHEIEEAGLGTVHEIFDPQKNWYMVY